MAQQPTRDEAADQVAPSGGSLSARVNDRHGHGDSMFIEPTPREIHDLMELAAEAEAPPAS